ncbi:MAG: hypothetical protein AAGF97_16720, partial [Planctomycetota bacterium]
MLSVTDNEPHHHELLTDTSNIEQLRAQRVWQLVNVAWMTWLFFTCYCWFRGFEWGTLLCLGEVVLLRLLIEFHRGMSDFRRIMNLVLGITAFGLLV